MAQTAAQKAAAAAKKKAADKKLLADAQALLAKQKANLVKLQQFKKELDTARQPIVGTPLPSSFKPTIMPTASPDAIGPMLGANLGSDAASILAYGSPADKEYILSNPETLRAATEYNKLNGLNTDGTKIVTKEKPTKEVQDAYALLEAAFKLYDLDSLVPIIRQYMEDDLGPEQAKLKLKTEPIYKQRFKGNELRLSKGLNALSETDYLELENDYSKTLTDYGLSDYFGVATNAATRAARQQKMADVIGNNISALEFKDRIKTVVTRVNMADANVKTELKAFYNITDTDLVKYFLNPAEGTDRLKEKVTAAEISAASITQGLGKTSLGTAEELARLGIDRAEALAGYSKIAEYLPTAEKLSSIYQEEKITYNKATGEEEEFKGLASAKRARERLKQKETDTFSASPGISQFSLKTKNTAGQI
jgi:hypothetical protein